MEINSQLPKTSLYNLLNNQTKDQNPPNLNPKLEKIPEKAPVQTSTQAPQEIPSTETKKRETYGLLVLELMSDNEYEAFQRATAGMSEGEKMLAAQSLYSLTSFYNGKYGTEEKPTSENSYEKNAQKAFGIQAQNLNNFLERYKNAYGSSQTVDITL